MSPRRAFARADMFFELDRAFRYQEDTGVLACTCCLCYVYGCLVPWTCTVPLGNMDVNDESALFCCICSMAFTAVKEIMQDRRD